jgi:hypothetical protein
MYGGPQSPLYSGVCNMGHSSGGHLFTVLEEIKIRMHLRCKRRELFASSSLTRFKVGNNIKNAVFWDLMRVALVRTTFRMNISLPSSG